VNITAVGDVPSLSQYVQGVDWRQVGSSIQWISGGQQPTTGATYYVTWNRSKLSAEYLPVAYSNDMNAIRNTYGFELVNGVVTPITTAVNLMFQNGAPRIIISQALTAGQTDMQTAIDAMKAFDVDIICAPQSTNSTLTQYMRNHVLTQSAPGQRHERVFLTSADGFSDATTTIVAKATSYATDRFWMVAPPAFNLVLQDAVTKVNQTVFLSSQYLAAAVAGSVCNPANDAATPLTRESIIGPSDLSTFNYLDSDKDYLAQNGVMVIEFGNRGGLQIRHGVTTDTTSVNTVTPSIRLIKDYILKTLRPLLDRTYIGTKIDSQTPSKVATTISTYLDQQIANVIIQKKGTITVTQSTFDPRTINVTFSFMPIYPLEFMDISFSLLLN
jgi:hypothetical protein